MIDFMNYLVSLFDLDLNKVLMFIFMTVIFLLMLVSIIKTCCSVKEFIDKVVNAVLTDFKTNKNKRHKNH